MKKYLLTLVLLLAALPVVFAQDPRSIIKVRLTDNSPISVAVDNKYFNEANRVLTVSHLPPGRHRLKVFLASTDPRISSRRTVYDGYFRVSPGTINYIVVDRFKGTVRINTAKRSDVETHDAHDPIDRSKYPQHDRGGRGDDRYNDRDKDRYDDKYSSRDQAYDYDRNDRDDRYNPRDDRYNDGHGSGRVMSQRDMDDLRARVASRITDTDKLKMLKSGLAGRDFTTEQVRVMLSWLSFDSSKLDFAGWAYDNVLDRTNFWRLEDVFSFGSSKDEFNSIINNGRR
jgi:hypothetical protein